MNHPLSRAINLSSGKVIAIEGDTYDQCAASLLRQRLSLHGGEFDEAALTIDAWFAPVVDPAQLEREETAGRAVGYWLVIEQMVREELQRHVDAGGVAVGTGAMMLALAKAKPDNRLSAALKLLSLAADVATEDNPVEAPAKHKWTPSFVGDDGIQRFITLGETDAETLRNALATLPLERLALLGDAAHPGIRHCIDAPAKRGSEQWSSFAPGWWVETRGGIEKKVRILRRACAAVGWDLESNA